MIKKILCLILSISLISCEKNEIPKDFTARNVVTDQISLESDYKYQIFYDLGTKSVVSQNLKIDWDLAFESSKDGFHIIINSSTFSGLSYIDSNNFNEIITNQTVQNLDWSWDNPNGNLNSTAFGDFRNKNGFFILDRGSYQGQNLNVINRGYKKIQIDTVNNEFYSITYANLDNSEYNTINIFKEDNKNFIFFSFNKNNTVNIQPPPNEWDLIFSQYTHLFNNNETPSYLVTGVLSNHGVLIAKDTLSSFEEITYNDAINYSFASNADEIGYNWKEYSFDNNSYNVKSNINYIIIDKQEKYYKLRFIDFYNEFGEKGYPTFEIQELYY